MRRTSDLRELVWAFLWACVLVVMARRARGLRLPSRLYWGPDPIISLKYWSDALRDAGYDSTTLVTHNYPAFAATRFDRYHEEVVGASHLPGRIKGRSVEYVVFLHMLKRFDVVHIPFTGGPLGRTPLAWLEPHLYRLAGIRTVIVPYGSDFLRYSRIQSAVAKQAMLLDYPTAGRREDEVGRRVDRWMKHADIVVGGGLMVEGASRWDVLVTNFISVTPERLKPRERWSDSDGQGAAVKIVHAPNHRGVKGTEFIIEAVAALQREGHAIELDLLENTPNEEVLERLRDADICVDNAIGGGYGLLAIEAMGSGATVLGNLEDRQQLDVFRYFGWLEQCPIVSSGVDQLQETLSYLVRNPSVRAELGQLGVEYVRRFHSPEMAQYLFGSIYRRLAGEDVDLLRLFDPSTSEFMRRFEPLRPPLTRNRPRIGSE